MTHELQWGDHKFGGTSLLRVVPELGAKKARFTELSGQNPYGPDAYVDEDRGYDGWELYGRFKGVRFTLYTRWGNFRVGGEQDLDVDGLVEVLHAL